MIGVYGANGFIGRHLVRRLASLELSVRAVSRHLDNDFTSEFSSRVDFVEADIRDTLAAASSLQGVETVVQLVSSSSPGLENNYEIQDIHDNVVPQVAFLQSSIKAGVKRYIFLSSGGTVYGPGAPVPTPETHLPFPINSHGLTKVVVEKYIQMHGHTNGLEYVILRVTNPYGPGQRFWRGQGLVPAILDRWRGGKPVIIYGTGQALRDYIYIDDLVDAIIAAIAMHGLPRHILNIGSGETRSVNQVVNALEQAVGECFEREFAAERLTDVAISSLDINLAHKILSWRPRINFEDALQRTVAAYLEVSERRHP